MIIFVIIAIAGMVAATGPGDYVSTNTTKPTHVYEPPGSLRR